MHPEGMGMYRQMLKASRRLPSPRTLGHYTEYHRMTHLLGNVVSDRYVFLCYIQTRIEKPQKQRLTNRTFRF